jgi:hypothetical protein
MFHNKLLTNTKLDDRITFLTHNDNYTNRVYNLIISNLQRENQYDRYYIVNSDMLFFNSQMRVVTDTPYEDIMEELVDSTIKNHKVMTELATGKSLLIFDFGSEIAPLSTDATTLYGIINEHFKDIDCAENVVYWTMYESPYSIVDKSECAVNIVSASLSTLRYIAFNYDACLSLTHNNDVPAKSAMYLNRRVRTHRTKLLIECLRREVNIDDMHFSYIGSDELIGENGVDVSYNLDMIDLIQAKVDKNQISRNNFEKVVSELYGKCVAMEGQEIIKWLGSSKVERVLELFNHRTKSKFEIITEYTCTETDIQISEKLSLAILSKIPFVVIGDKGYIKHLKKLGFKTFDKFWSEEYDGCTGDERIKSITSTILDVQQNFNCELDEYDNWIYSDEMNEILEHNYIHYKDEYSQTLYDRIVTSTSRGDSVSDRYNLKDKVWYHKNEYDEDIECIFVPIPGNNSEYFEEVVAEQLKYKLMNRKDIPNLKTIDAYAVIKTPENRMKDILLDTSMTFNGFIKKHKDTEYMKSQNSFIKGLNIQGVINFEDWGLSEEHLPEGGSEFDKIRNWYFFKPGIEPSMSKQLHLTADEKNRVNEMFKEDTQL